MKTLSVVRSKLLSFSLVGLAALTLLTTTGCYVYPTPGGGAVVTPAPVTVGVYGSPVYYYHNYPVYYYGGRHFYYANSHRYYYNHPSSHYYYRSGYRYYY